MRQVTGLTSTYSSDVFGICSALYELGGMVVMHDASGCNSTYTTHDEPRWYDMDSMIYVSAISEMEAILGDDEKWITDLTETALELKPRFIALVLAPIPYMTGTDVKAIAQAVEMRTGIKCFAFTANGMHDYTVGVSDAMEQIVGTYAVRQSADSDVPEIPLPPVFGGDRSDAELAVNFLGVTPLDFPWDSSVDALRRWADGSGMKSGVCLSMGCSLEDIAQMHGAQVNLVVSSGGLDAAKLLHERYGIPYVVGAPFGKAFAEYLAGCVREAAVSGENMVSYAARAACGERTQEIENKKTYALIGEAVTSASLAAAIGMDLEVNVKVLCPLESGSELLRPGDIRTPEEDDLIREIKKVDGVIADPLYRTLCPGKEFYPLPHTAFSGRIYEKNTPNLIGSLEDTIC